MGVGPHAVVEQVVELDIDRTFDARNRLNTIDAAYFDVSSHQIADYDYTGPWRVRKKTLGEAYTGSANFENGTYLSTAYDGLRRTNEYVWKNKDNDVLVGFG